MREHNWIGTELDAELEAIEARWAASVRCASCREHHSPDVMCPPHEVRTTGQSWTWNRREELEAIAADVPLLLSLLRERLAWEARRDAEVARLRAQVDHLEGYAAGDCATVEAANAEVQRLRAWLTCIDQWACTPVVSAVTARAQIHEWCWMADAGEVVGDG